SHTIRGWERDGLLPRSMLPHRDEKDWRYWTPAQLEKIKEWMERNEMAPGKGLSGFDPTVLRVQEMLGKLRQPRDIPTVKCPHCGGSFKNLAAHLRRAHPAAA